MGLFFLKYFVKLHVASRKLQSTHKCASYYKLVKKKSMSSTKLEIKNRFWSVMLSFDSLMCQQNFLFSNELSSICMN